MTPRVGLLGGTFDPIHLGHLDLGEAAQQALGLDRVICLPAHVPPHRPAPLASAFHRFAMTAIAVAGRDGWQASDLELLDPNFSFTATTLQRFHAQGYDPSQLFFVIGADAFADIASWRHYPSLLDLSHFAVVSRPGHPVLALRERLPALEPRMVDAADFPSTREARSGQAPARGAGPGDGTVIILIDATTADVSSTGIRSHLAQHLPIDEMVTPGVLQHIAQHGLYRSPQGDRHDAPRA
jgi:nicotinate-nucleotide adenylyltransferase